MPEISTNGMAIAPGVIDTIVALAIKDVPGVDSESASPNGIRSLLFPRSSSRKVNVTTLEDGSLSIEVALRVLGGHPIQELASLTRSSIADAVVSQTGIPVSRVDIRIDGIRFQD